MSTSRGAGAVAAETGRLTRNSSREAKRRAIAEPPATGQVYQASSYGLARFRCRSAPQQSFSTQIFIHVGPVDAVTPAGNSPVLPLLRSGIEETRKPSQGHTDDTAVAQGHAEGILRELDVQHP